MQQLRGQRKSPAGLSLSVPQANIVAMPSEPSVPSLSVPALHELRRIYCKHLLEVFASPETVELYERGCIEGTFTGAEMEKGRSFQVRSVTPLGVAALEARERAATQS